MIDVTRAKELGWVEDCAHCAEGRKALSALREFRHWSTLSGTTAEATGLEHVSIKCDRCDGRGWTLTGDGAALVDMVQELYPELARRCVAEEIPF